MSFFFFIQLSIIMYRVDLDAPPSSTPDWIVSVPKIQVDNEETYLTAFQHVNPLFPDHDDDYGITVFAGY